MCEGRRRGERERERRGGKTYSHSEEFKGFSGTSRSCSNSLLNDILCKLAAGWELARGEFSQPGLTRVSRSGAGMMTWGGPLLR